MVENVKLYINGKLVEFSTDPKILFTYQVKDYNNPTVVKNSFSKTLTIDGTPNNNDIFGHYWNLERFLMGSGEGGAFFNSSKKAPFQLFIGADLYEEGYCKLDNISRNGSDIKYSVTLYGGLGDFFFNLSTTDDGNEKKLSDLTYMPSGDTNEFDFTVNIDTVNTAWNALKNGTRGKWQYINFMPAYNGKPEDFDADKVIINLSGTSLNARVKNADDGKYYTPKQGFTVGTLPNEMTEWDVRDLRSYLQRPCIKMSSIINACCNPTQNGGYTVNLDPDFFNNNNPYWKDTWLSLPMVGNLEYSSEAQILDGAELIASDTTGDTNGLMYQDIRFDLGEINGNISNITVNAKIKPTYAYTDYDKTSYVWFWNWNGDDYHSGWWCLGSLFCQLIAVNGDTVVGASDVYNLTTPIRHNGHLWYGHNGHYPESNEYDSSTGLRKMGNGTQYIPYMNKPIYSVLGKFTPNGFVTETSYTSAASTYSNTPRTFTFSINNIGTNVTGLKMVYYWGATADKIKHAELPNRLVAATDNVSDGEHLPYDDGWFTMNNTYSTVTLENHKLELVSHNLSAVMGESLGRTGTKINKQLLLNTESTPCDYLLSYCKMFGLHFTKEIGSKTINILTRKSFYNRSDIVDLSNYIDLSKQVDIQPIMFKSKWYQFLQEKDETQLQQKYLTAKGVEYGSKVLDTGYEFSADKVDLLEDNCIKSGIECLEKSKWFTAYNNDDSLRPWMSVGLKYVLWNGADEFEYNAGIGNTGDIMPINEGEGMKYYDIFPKLQFHDSDNGPTDGNNCLVFLSGFKKVNSGRSNPLTYILSDDSVYQTEMNEGTPCWLFTKYETVNNKRLCYKLSQIPVFERYLTSNNGGVISKSLDFGSAQELYIPNYTLTDNTNIYYGYWRTYLNDLFDVNTKQMTAYLRIDTNPGLEWIRRFYWYDNAMWVINKISDWNPASYDTVKVELVKVQDLLNYSSIVPKTPETIQLSASTYNIPYSGGSATLRVYGIANNVSWRLTRTGDANVGYMYPTSGVGPGDVTIVFGASQTTALTNCYIRAIRNDNAANSTIQITQGYSGEQTVSVYPDDIVFPASGGDITVSFTWHNQGNAYIDYIDSSESEEALSFTADTQTLREENKAVIHVGQNTGDTALTNYCTFYSNSADCNCSIGICQLPSGYTFVASGETKTLHLGNQATGATFTNIPYWLTITETGHGNYSLVVDSNYNTSERNGVVTVTLDGTSADFVVTQAAGSGIDSLVTPNVLVFDSTGGTQTLSVAIQNVWRIVARPSWLTTSVDSGATPNHVYVTAQPYSGTEERQGTIVFYDSTNSKTYLVTVIQQPADGEMLAVNPSRLTFPASGGTILLTIISNTDWTIA